MHLGVFNVIIYYLINLNVCDWDWNNNYYKHASLGVYFNILYNKSNFASIIIIIL